MICVKGTSLEISELTEVEPILFCLEDGTYFYVESGIVDNELRVMKNWKIAERSDGKSWFIIYEQGVQIPIELGDYLVEMNTK